VEVIDHARALRPDGSSAAWGSNAHGPCRVPALSPGTTCTRLATGRFHAVAIQSDRWIIADHDSATFCSTSAFDLTKGTCLT
jgi:hypothetical protein